MRDELRSISDACRAALNEYTERAFSLLPPIDGMRILDAGCGTGEPALALARMSAAHICAIDPDGDSCAAMGRKVARGGFSNRVTVMNVDFASPEVQKNPFDVVRSAEGELAAIEEQMKRPENLRSVFYILRKRDAHD